MNEEKSGLKKKRNFIVSGDSFDIGFSSYFSTNDGKTISSFLNEKRRLNIGQSDYSYRTINHWDSKGLINFDRNGDEGWRLFSVLDLFWIEIIVALRSFGLSIEQIKLIKNNLSSSGYFKHLGYHKIFEYYVASAMFQKQDVVMLVFPNSEADFATLDELNSSITIGTVPNTYICIGFNSIINNLFPKSRLPLLFRSHRSLSKEESAVLESIWEEGVSKVEIKMKDGSVSLIETSKITQLTKYQFTNNVTKILNDSEYQDIAVTRQGGETVHLTQTLKVKPSLL